jgi:hypothetical protein
LDIYKKATATDVLNARGIYNVTEGAFKYITSSGTTKIRP